MVKELAAAALLALPLLGVAAPTVAVEVTGSTFGAHVSACAQARGFDGQHNPGTHQGFSGWGEHHHQLRC